MHSLMQKKGILLTNICTVTPQNLYAPDCRFVTIKFWCWWDFLQVEQGKKIESLIKENVGLKSINQELKHNETNIQVHSISNSTVLQPKCCKKESNTPNETQILQQDKIKNKKHIKEYAEEVEYQKGVISSLQNLVHESEDKLADFKVQFARAETDSLQNLEKLNKSESLAKNLSITVKSLSEEKVTSQFCLKEKIELLNITCRQNQALQKDNDELKDIITLSRENFEKFKGVLAEKDDTIEQISIASQKRTESLEDKLKKLEKAARDSKLKCERSAVQVQKLLKENCDAHTKKKESKIAHESQQEEAQNLLSKIVSFSSWPWT